MPEPVSHPDALVLDRRQALRAGVGAAAWSVPVISAVLLTEATAQAASPMPNPVAHEPVRPRAAHPEPAPSREAEHEAADAGALAQTGTSPLVPAAVGTALVAGGAAAVGLSRSRRRSEPADPEATA